MSAEDGGKYSKLYPTQNQIRFVYQLIIRIHVSSQVMSPIAITYIGCCSCKIRFKGQGLITDIGITRESYLIAMASQSSPTMKDDGAMVSTLSSLVKKDMVAPESLTQSLGIRTGKILLPIKPPEIYAFTFMISDNITKERLCKIGIVQTPLNGITFKILAIQILSHLREISWRFYLVNTISRV